MRSLRLTSIAAAAGIALAASAAPPPPATAATAVTVYSRDLGFVRESRTLTRDARGDTVEIADLPARLDFSSLRVGLAGAGRIERLAQEDEMPDADALMGLVGRPVRVVLRGDRTVEGGLVRVDGAWLVLREKGGAVQSLARSAVEAIAIQTPGDWPPPLRPPGSPVRAVLNGTRGAAEAELSYLTGGLSWSAEHTLVREGEGKGAWRSAVVVENASGRSYRDATLKLVAGEPNRVGAMPMPKSFGRAMSMEVSASAELAEEAFSEYHLYTLDRPATLHDRERQQLTMLPERDVTFTPRYRYRGGDGRGVQLQLEIPNTRGTGLGAPIPAGRVRILERDASRALQFAGESRVAHTAEGETLRVEVGAVFDLVAERRELANRRIADRERETTVAITLRNRKKTDVTIIVDEPVSGDVTVTKSSHPALRPDAGTVRFDVPVKAGASVTVEYTARIRY